MSAEQLKVGVLGAGAVGCFFGGMLARAGCDVTLIGRPAHVEAIRKSGLLFEGVSVNERVPLRASTSAADLRGARLVLFCVRTASTTPSASPPAPGVR